MSEDAIVPSVGVLMAVWLLAPLWLVVWLALWWLL